MSTLTFKHPELLYVLNYLFLFHTVTSKKVIFSYCLLQVCPDVHLTEVNKECPVCIYFLKAKAPFHCFEISSFYETLRKGDCLFSHSACERCQKVFSPNEEEDMDVDMPELI